MIMSSWSRKNWKSYRKKTVEIPALDTPQPIIIKEAMKTYITRKRSR